MRRALHGRRGWGWFRWQAGREKGRREASFMESEDFGCALGRSDDGSGRTCRYEPEGARGLEQRENRGGGG